MVQPPKTRVQNGSLKRRRRMVALIFFIIITGAMALPLFEYFYVDIFSVKAAVNAENRTNQRANYWRAVRDGVAGYTTVKGQESGVLIQNGGQNWRRIRNGPVANFSPWVMAIVLLAIGVFYVFAGQQKLVEHPSGERVKRWTLSERVLHWYTAILFVVMVLSGLSMLFGRAVLIPLLGHQNFSAYLGVTRMVHNYAGPFFIVGILIEIIIWIRYNIPKKIDWDWIKQGGGFIGSRPHPHAGRINAGEKAWFWIIATAGLGVGVTGLIMGFPNFGQPRAVMQIANIIHASLATLFIAASFGHIYIGTIGAEGTWEGMIKGHVSAEWAKKHQDLWYEEVVEEVDEGEKSLI
jgi:formate dehydrogenase subunit gamma